MAKIYPASRTVELTVLSGENLRIDKRSIKKNSFVIVRSTDGGNDCRTTEIDTQGGSYPKWNEKLVVDLPVQSPAVSVEVYCKTAFGNRLVGVARVPVSDFSGGYVPENYLHFLSYRLRDLKGERNGIINISVRTKVPPTPEYSCSSPAPLVGTHTVGVPVGKSSFSGGVVTGVPVWCASNDERKFHY
ncbi:BON1-associated protein 2-like [Humulus lupulus]|uniref:BON1-associated protein 2-like n=1 Tax=Humulus lupulus TaxID=3486 RepID=UPI002B408A2F|nr:BON1-associated protein 2-like [Humulus lupulus]